MSSGTSGRSVFADRYESGSVPGLATVFVCLVVGVVLMTGGAVGEDDRSEKPYGVQDSADVSIDTTLAEANGTVEVIVDLPASNGDTTAEMKTHATTTQSDIVSFAKHTDGVTVLNTFWLGNSVLLEVDTDRVSLDSVASVNNVKSLNPNVRLKALPDEDGSDGDAGDDESSGDRDAGDDESSSDGSADDDESSGDGSADDDESSDDGSADDESSDDGSDAAGFGPGSSFLVLLAGGLGVGYLFARHR